MADWVTGRQWGLYLYMSVKQRVQFNTHSMKSDNRKFFSIDDSHFLSSPPLFSSSFLYSHFFTFFLFTTSSCLTVIVFSCLLLFSLRFLLSYLFSLASSSLTFPLCLFLCGDGVTRWRFMLISPWSHSRDILTESWFSSNMILTRPRSLIQSKL